MIDSETDVLVKVSISFRDNKNISTWGGLEPSDSYWRITETLSPFNGEHPGYLYIENVGLVNVNSSDESVT